LGVIIAGKFHLHIAKHKINLQKNIYLNMCKKLRLANMDSIDIIENLCK